MSAVLFVGLLVVSGLYLRERSLRIEAERRRQGLREAMRALGYDVRFDRSDEGNPRVVAWRIVDVRTRRGAVQ